MKCFKCMKNFKSCKLYMKHVNISHKLERVLLCKSCPQERSFKSKNSFRKHIQQHFNLESNTKFPECTNLDDIANQPKNIKCISAPFIENIINAHNSDLANCPEIFETFRNLVDLANIDLVSKLYSNKLVCKKTIQSTLNTFSEYILEGIFKNIKDSICKLIAKEDEQVKGKIFQLFSIFSSSFDDISTEYKRALLLKKNNLYTASSSVNIGERVDVMRVGSDLILKTIPVKAKIISAKETLIQCLNSNGMFQEILNYLTYLKSEENVTSNLMQTEFWAKKASLYRKTDIVLPVLIYFDEFEVNNPLGSRAGLQNLGAVYMSLPCIPPLMRSKLNNIFLLMLFNSLDKRSYGNIIFQPVIDELKYLECTGIEVSNKRVFFLVAACTGDNKGLNSMLGFTDCFVANFYCRICKMHKCESKSSCVEKESLLRTEANYTEDVEKNNVSVTGIWSMCLFNQLKHFNVWENHTVDIMHDIFEGVLNLEIALILKQFIFQEKLFTLEMLNNRLNFFDFGNNYNTNKPPEISEDHLKHLKLRYSASETLWISKFLGIIIGEWVPEDNIFWNLFILLKQIIDIILLDSIASEDILCIEYLISQHHKLFVDTFHMPLKPKHHLMTHYPRIMRKMGPLKQLWSMRFEAKHRQLKMIASSTSSRKNICHTIVERLLLSQSFQNSINSLDKNVECIPGRKMNKFNNDVEKHITSLQALYSNCLFVTSVSSNNDTIKIGQIIQVESSDEYPRFGIIETICFYSSQRVLAIVRFLNTLFFDVHRHCHRVSETNLFECRNLINDLKQDFLLVKHDGQLIIV